METATKGDGELTQSERTALIILDTIRRERRGIGSGKTAKILKGSKAKEIVQFGYDHNTYYGRLAAYRTAEIKVMLEQLIELKYLKVIGGAYPMLRLTPQGEAAIHKKVSIPLELPRQISPKTTERKNAEIKAGGTVEYSAQLLGEGLSVEQVAAQRGLSPGTIYGHAAKLIAAGRISIDRIIEEDARQKIEAAIRQVGCVDILYPIKILLPEEIDYNRIRCVVENWKHEHPSFGFADPSIDADSRGIQNSEDQIRRRRKIPGQDLVKYVVALGDSKSESAVTELIACLENSDGNVRRLAASALGKIEDRRAVQPLIELLSKEKKPQVRQYAVKALGCIGDPFALSCLESISNDPQEKEYTRKAAQGALSKIVASKQPWISLDGSVDVQASSQKEDAIESFLSRPRPRALKGPWRSGLALGFHSQFNGSAWMRSKMGDLAYRLKYQNDFSVLPALVDAAVDLFANYPELAQVDALTPVPPSMARENDPVSGFTQALAERLGLAFWPVLVKSRKTAPQKEMRTLAQKRANVAGAFKLSANIRGKRLLVVDDLYDSGATLEEVYRLLRRSGAAQVNVLTLTRTIHSDA